MSGFILKIIAAVTMLIDHAGLMLFPAQRWMRVVGRLAFPIYAYMIAEGFRYTHSRMKYFLRVFLLGTVCQIVYAIAGYELLLGILIAFSLSILLMALLDRAKEASKENSGDAWAWWAAFAGAVAAVFFLCEAVDVDYGFFGVLLPVWPSAFEGRGARLGAFGLGLAGLCAANLIGGNALQCWSLLAMVPLVLYTGKPGAHRMKWFFYIFYPAHLAVLAGIEWVVEWMRA